MKPKKRTHEQFANANSKLLRQYQKELDRVSAMYNARMRKAAERHEKRATKLRKQYGYE